MTPRRLRFPLNARVVIIITLLLVALFNTPKTFAQWQRPAGAPIMVLDTVGMHQKLNALVTARVEELNVPGYSLAVVYKGKIIIKKGYGFADIEKKIPVTPKTVFGLASVTKTFTALALLTLVDEGRVNLSDPLSKYYGNLSPAYQNITILQLASMSAGVPHAVDENAPWPLQIQKAQALPLESTPGTAYKYSNLSYRILGGVIQKAIGQSYAAFLQDRIFSRLHMTNTKATDQSFFAPLAVPYNDNREPTKGYKRPDINFAAGMLASNLPDMIKYAQGLLDRKLLSKASYNLLWVDRQNLPNADKNTESGWAFGWGSTKQNNHLRVGMNGGLPGEASSILIYPDDDLIIVGLSNMSGAGHEITGEVAKEVMAAERR